VKFRACVRVGAVAAVLAAISVTSGCGPGPPAPQRLVELTGEIRLPPEAGTGGRVYVSLFQAWSLEGELRHPLQLIESFEAAPGAFSHKFEYPENKGEGLIVFAWVDLDGDGVHCTMSSRRDLSGLSEVTTFPADQVSVTVTLTEPCRGPDWFFPPRADREK
jgi:hypothetical protein